MSRLLFSSPPSVVAAFSCSSILEVEGRQVVQGPQPIAKLNRDTTCHLTLLKGGLQPGLPQSRLAFCFLDMVGYCLSGDTSQIPQLRR